MWLSVLGFSFSPISSMTDMVNQRKTRYQHGHLYEMTRALGAKDGM